MKYPFYKPSIFYLLIFPLISIFLSSCGTITPTVAPANPTTGYMKMQPPADSDKPLPVPSGDGSCWLHTASNMLAGAGYGNGSTLQERATDIWNDMDTNYRQPNGNFLGGWPPSAIQWWLASTNNTWTATNPYTLVSTYGSGKMAPWANANGAMTVANELRSCNMVGLAIRWPNGSGGQGGHAITLWGDEQTDANPLTINPGELRVTDSDTDIGGDVQAYTYDAFNNPNPGGLNEGNGWYFNAYGGNHPYISAAFAFSRTTAGAGANSARVTGSYKIQNTSEQAASDLHYKVGTDVDILTYRTYLVGLGR